MNDIVPFQFEGASVRVVTIDGEPWFVARDVVEAVDAVWHHTAIKHVPDQWKGGDRITTPGGLQEMAVLSEQGVYFYLARSDKPKALPIQMWIAGEVLPSIRKTGGYGITDPMKVFDDPATLRAALITYSSKVIEERSRADRAEESLQIAAVKVEEMRPAVAALDRIANSDGSMCIMDAAKTMQVKPKALFTYLRSNGWIYSRSGSKRKQEVAHQDKIVAGYLEHKIHIRPRDDGSEQIFTRVHVTPRGLAKLAKIVPGAIVTQAQLQFPPTHNIIPY